MAPTPLYAFQLPAPLIADFEPRQLHIPASHPLHPSNQQAAIDTSPAPQEPTSSQLAIGGAYSCALTGASFPDLASLKEHYKTDWYKYNVKLRMQGRPTGVSEEQFAALVEGLSDSLSGSDSSSDSDSAASSSSSTNAVSRLLRKQQLDRPAAARDDDDELDPLEALEGPRSALMWFEAANVNPGTQYGVYRAALPVAGGGKKRIDGGDLLKELKSLQLPEQQPKGAPQGKERKWTLLMFGGGHFAGMVVSLVPRLVSRGKGKEKEKEVVVLEKKTFHRYTTRRKQGGSQGANDNANGKAKSAGAQIRRHNEMALRDEVQELLSSWQEQIDESELVFLRCSKSNYKTFFGYDDAVLDKKDPRIRGFSFPTRRPTINELIRAFTELTRVKTSHLSATALAQLDADYLASITPTPAPAAPTPKAIAPKSVVVKLTREEELERDRWTRMVDMVKKGKVEPLSSFLDKYGPELEQAQVGGTPWGTLPAWMEEARLTPTLLHVASAADQAEMVRWLLVEKRADPTLQPPIDPSPSSAPTPPRLALTASEHVPTPPPGRAQQTPYEVAPSRATRNVFRLLTTQQPDWWDWTGSGVGGARVPSGLNEEKEEERDAKGRERRSKLRDKLKEREKGRAEKERVEHEEKEREEAERKAREEAELKRTGGHRVTSTGPQRLGGGPPMKMQERELAGLSEEQRMRVERERRLRAIEARMAK